MALRNTAKMRWKDKTRIDRMLKNRQSNFTDSRMEKAMRFGGAILRRELVNRLPIKSGNLRSAVKVGAVILTSQVVIITIYASGEFGTALYQWYIEKGGWENLGVISKAHNRGGKVGKHAWLRTFADKGVEEKVLSGIEQKLFAR